MQTCKWIAKKPSYQVINCWWRHSLFNRATRWLTKYNWCCFYYFRSSYQSHQVPALPLTSSTQCNDMPEYSNLPQPRQQASIASAAAAVAAQAAAQAGNSSTSFNSKRSRHSSLWSLEDEQELLEQDHSNTSDRVNYVNDPFGHTSEFASTPAGIQMMRQQQLNDEMESQMRSSFQNNSSSNSKPRHSATGSAASSEAF